MHIIQDFQKWKKVNEQEVPGRERERGTENNKVVAIPVDKSTLKLKIVNDADVIDANGKLTPAGFNSIINWIKSQGEIIKYYSSLNDLTSNIVIYSISKDNSRKQVVLFKIYSKTELKQQDPSAKGIDPQVKFIRQDELPAALGGTILNVTGAQQMDKPKTETTGLTLPVKSEAILNSNSGPLIKFITGAYNAVKAKVTGSPILPKVKSEVQSTILGSGSQTFVKALNAGFGILDAEFKEDIEKDITQTLVDKLQSPDTINVDEFNKIASVVSQVSTGDIKVPAGGFREGMQNDPELKKFQDILAKKLARHLKNHATYQAFIKAGKKGFLGNYGPLTHNLVVLLKSIAENPPYPNRDGSIIEADFVSMIQGINEEFYLGLDGATLINESTFNFGNAEAIEPSKTAAPVQKKAETDVKKPASSNPFKSREEIRSFQKWVIDKKGDSAILGSDGADGSWGPKTAAAYSKYGKDYKKPEKSTDVKTSYTDLDKSFIDLGNDIKKFIETPSRFSAYTDPVNDDESGAWEDVVKPEWKNNWKPRVGKLKSRVEALPAGEDKNRYESTIKTLYAMFYTDESLLKDSSTFYSTFLGETSSDIFKLILKLSGSQVAAIKINTDFE